MLAIAGGKGGCGKTTVALGLAAAYGRQRRRPLVVDADVDTPNLHLLAATPADPRPIAGDRRPADPSARAHPSPDYRGVDVLPGGSGPDTDVGVADSLARLPDDRPVLVDCPAGASRAVADPLRRADAALLVTTTDRQTVEDALKTAAMARALGTPLVGVVCNRADAAPSTLAAAVGAPCLSCLPRTSDPLVACSGAFDRLAVAVGPNP